MALWIQNVTPGERDDDQPHEYVVRVNNGPPMAQFRHIRSEGAAACFRAAADALDAAPTSPGGQERG